MVICAGPANHCKTCFAWDLVTKVSPDMESATEDFQNARFILPTTTTTN